MNDIQSVSGVLDRDVKQRFELAQKAFSNGAYKTAVFHAQYVNSNIEAAYELLRSSKKSDVRFSLVLLSYRHSDEVMLMIEHLKRYSEDRQFELVLVDNGNEHLRDIADDILKDFVYIKTNFNIGCSGGRNIGARVARGEYVAFIDDDGELADGAVEALVEAITSTDAVTVRGRVVTKTEGGVEGTNYNKGSFIVPSLPDAEGISIWRRKDFIDFGGFDILLSGHEGLRLCCDMFRFYGPEKFLYTPEAVLRHDFSSGGASAEKKKQLHESNRKYLNFLDLPWREIIKHMRDRAGQNRNCFLSSFRFGRSDESDAELIDVVTTVRNGADYVDDYVRGFLRQSHQAFRLVVVDDGSTDGGVERLSEIWPDEDRLKVIRTTGVGRSAALNIAIANATASIIAIADIDDIPLASRLALTAQVFRVSPELGAVSFYSFSEEQSMRAAQPVSVAPVSLLARSLLGMPVSFPTFAFRKEFAVEPFDEALEAGVDCDWITRNMRATGLDGRMMPSEQVYYRVHDGQISSRKKELQRDVAIRCLFDNHREILSDLSDEDIKHILLFSRWEALKSGAELKGLFAYCVKLAHATHGSGRFDSDTVRSFIWEVFSELRFQIVERDCRDWRASTLKLREGLGIQKTMPELATEFTYGTFGWRRAFVPLVRVVVSRTGTKANLEAYNRDPVGFLMSLREPRYRRFRRWLFPQ